MKPGTKQALVLVAAPIAVALIAVTVWAIATAPDKTPVASGSPAVTTSTSVATATAYSNQCKLAVLDWSGEANKIQGDLAFGAPDHANSGKTLATANRVTVYCPKSLAAKVTSINYTLTLGEARLVAHQKMRGDQVLALRNAIDGITSLVK